jgi:tetraacyldisaccharide 4'-kinase
MSGGMRSELFRLFTLIHENPRWKPIVIVVLFPLFLASIIFRFIATVRVFFYRVGFFKSEKLPAYVVSVGNLTTGGSGKTPVVIHLAKMFVTAGISVAIISRGYGFEVKGDYLVVSDREGVRCSPGEAPDEALMTANKLIDLKGLSGVPVIVGPNRVHSGKAAVDLFDVDVIVMDDGYQHLKVRRDLNILVVDGENPFGNRLMLPAGPLREPLKASKRADVVWINSKSQQSDLDTTGFLEGLKRYLVDNIPVVKSALLPDRVLGFTGEMFSKDVLHKKRVLAFSGIQRPDAFFSVLKDLGAIVVYELPFSDHYVFSDDDFKVIEKMAILYNAEMVVTTEKDFARISRDIKWRIPLSALVMSLAATGDKAILNMVNMVVTGLGTDETKKGKV